MKAMKKVLVSALAAALVVTAAAPAGAATSVSYTHLTLPTIA